MTRSTTRSARRSLLLPGGAFALAAGVGLAIAAPTAASAHVNAAASTTAAGAYTVVTFSLAHGCDGSATTALDITIPEGIDSVSPTVNPNWTVAKNEVQLDTPITDSHGASITQRVSNVVYTAVTPLADGFRDTVSLQLQLPADAAGETLAFPVLQTCETGSTDWSEPVVEGEAEPEHPAPTVLVTAAEEEGADHGAAAEVETAASATASSPDVLARILGVGGLVVGAVGLAVAAASRRRAGTR